MGLYLEGRSGSCTCRVPCESELGTAPAQISLHAIYGEQAGGFLKETAQAKPAPFVFSAAGDLGILRIRYIRFGSFRIGLFRLGILRFRLLRIGFFHIGFLRFGLLRRGFFRL
jgi:hypothetical protein